MKHLGLVVAVGLVGCAHNVPQDRATGPDGKLKGARPVAIADGEAKVRGVVTYPGGDRVDWRAIQIPAGQRGTLDLQLTWQAPRPGLQVAFDVFDQWNTPVITADARRRGGRTRSATIADADGTYFVRIYAPKRGDAGAYVLKASFDQVETQAPDPRKVEIPDPPRLPAVPPPAPTCETFEPNNPACANACPFDAPKGWKGCGKRDADDDAKAAAEAQRQARAECLKNQPKAFQARIIHVEVNGDVRAIKLDTGSDEQAALTTGWTAKVLTNGTEKPMANGSVSLKSVGKQHTRATSNLTTDQLTANPYVRLSPPPADCP